MLQALRQDLRHGARALRRERAFTAGSLLALTLGIAVNTVVFTAYRAFVDRPIEARDPERLVDLTVRLRSGDTMARFSYPDFADLRAGLHSLQGVLAVAIEQVDVMPEPTSSHENATAFVVSESY